MCVRVRTLTNWVKCHCEDTVNREFLEQGAILYVNIYTVCFWQLFAAILANGESSFSQSDTPMSSFSDQNQNYFKISRESELMCCFH